MRFIIFFILSILSNYNINNDSNIFDDSFNYHSIVDYIKNINYDFKYYKDINDSSERDLAYNVYTHKEPQYSRVIDKIKNRENLDEEFIVFKFSANPKTLIIGDSRVCGLRKTDYGEETDLIGLSGATSYNINDVVKFIPDDYYERVIAWFSVNDYNYVNNNSHITINNAIDYYKNNDVLDALKSLSKKSKSYVYFVENSFGKEQNKYDIKNAMLKHSESIIDGFNNYKVLKTYINANSKYCYDGLHFTINGSQIIINDINMQIGYLESIN